MLNILFSGHDFKFLTPFIDHCEANPGLSVRLDKHRGHVIDSEAQAQEFRDWADIVFCEWALGNAVWYSRHKRPGQLLLVRLHSQEIEKCSHFLKEIDWAQVDRLIVICPFNYGRMKKLFPVIGEEKIVLVYNPIDARGRFSLPRMPGADFNLGFVGIVPRLKRLDLAFSIFEKVRALDSRYTLSIKGAKPQEYPWMAGRVEEMKWYNDLFARIDASPYRNSVIFEPHGPDMGEWYSHIGFLLSTSDFEGSHQAVAEGMAAGCIPVIRRWQGADQLYPARYAYPYDADAQQVCDFLLSWKRTPEIYLNEMDYCRRYAVEHFDQAEVCRKLDALLALHPRFAAEASVAETPLHVLLIGYIPPGARDGYRIRIEQLCTHLAEHGVRTTLACLHSPGDAAKLAGHAESLAEGCNCAVRLVECADFFDMALDQEKARTALEALETVIAEEQVDLIQAEALYAARYAVMLKQRHPDLPFVFDCHGASPEEEQMSGASPARVRTSERWEKLVLDYADLTIFVAAAMREHFNGKCGMEPENIVIPCCIRESFCREPQDAKPDLSLPPDRPVVGYVGTLAPWQCTEEMFTLLGALARRDPALYFVMIVPERDQKECLKQFRRVGIDGRDFRVVQLPHAEVPGALSHFSCGMLLRRDSAVNRVSSPTKFGEYLAAGVPVVLTDCIGDYSLLAERHGLGVVLKARPEAEWHFSEAEVDAVLEMIYDRFNREEEFVRRSVDFARSNILWDPHIGNLRQSYRRLLAR